MATTDFGALASAPTRTEAAPPSYDPTGQTQVTFTYYNVRGEAWETINPAGREQVTVYDDAGRVKESIQNYDVDLHTQNPVMEADANLITTTTYSAGQQVSSTATLTPNAAGQKEAVGNWSLSLDVPASAVTTASGGVYLMYDGVTGTDPRFSQAGYTGLYLVQYGSSGWTYYSTAEGAWLAFSPLASDVLLAKLSNFSDSSAAVTNLAGTDAMLYGMQEGYQTGNFSCNVTTTNGGSYYDIASSGNGFEPNFIAQTTQYVYDTQATSSSPDLYSDGKVTAVIYPDSTATYDPTTHSFSGTDLVKYTYDRQGEMTSMTDQNGTTHTYSYDGVGRLLSDSVTVPSGNPADIDTTVASIDYGYKVCGKLLTVSSEDSSGHVLNQVEYHYDSNGNADKEYQEHDGAVNTSTSLYVGYGYDMAANGYRPTTLQYPTSGTNSSRVLTDSYGTSGGMNDEIGRLNAIIDGTGTASNVTTGDTLDTLGYLGTGTIVSETYNQPNIGYDLTGTTDSTPNLDRFGRVENMFWSKYGTGGGVLDGYQYAYNLQGDVSQRLNAVDAAFSELFQNDKLDQLVSLARGTVSDGTIASPTFSQGWSPDGFGNWSSFRQTGSDATSQTRTANGANEISGISTTSGTSYVTPTYDLAGNMTAMPQPGNEATGLTCTYDAWNRLVHVTGSNGIDVSYQYDGLGRLIVRTDNTAASGTVSTTDLYYAGDQVLEERDRLPASPAAGATAMTQQFVWSPRYVDSPVLRTQTTATYSEGTSSWSSSTATYYYLTDANDNVTAVTDASGNVVERYVYSAFGGVQIYSPDYSTLRSASAVGNTLGFGGTQQDAVTAMNYMSARWYNPSTGGFISRDPAQSDENLYRYVGNDPTQFTDPSGLGDSGGQSGGGGTVGSWAPMGQPAAPSTPGPTPTCSPLQSQPLAGVSAVVLAAEQPGAIGSRTYGDTDGFLSGPMPGHTSADVVAQWERDNPHPAPLGPPLPDILPGETAPQMTSLRRTSLVEPLGSTKWTQTSVGMIRTIQSGKRSRRSVGTGIRS